MSTRAELEQRVAELEQRVEEVTAVARAHARVIEVGARRILAACPDCGHACHRWPWASSAYAKADALVAFCVNDNCPGSRPR